MAQDSVSIYSITDQLGSSSSSRAIYKGVFLANLNYNYSEMEIPGFGSKYNSWNHGPGLNLGYGISKRVDVRIGTGYSFLKYSNKSFHTTETGTKNFWTGILVGSRLNLFSQKKWRPELAFSANVFISNNTKVLTYEHLDLVLAWSYKLGDKFRLAGNFGWNETSSKFRSDGFFDPFYYTLNARYEWGKGIGFFADFYLPKSLENYHPTPSVGGYYRLNPNMQFHVRYRQFVDFNNQEYLPQFYTIGGGFSWLIGNN